jgi:type IV pilus assembly protein PilB
MDQNSTADDKQKSLLDFLVSRKLISTETATEILTEVETSGKSVNDIISEKNLINIEDFTRTKAEFFHFTYIDLSDRQIDEQTLNLVPMSIAEHYKLIAFEKIDNHIHVGLVDSNNFKAIEAMDFLAQKHKLKVDYFLISNLSFSIAFNQYKNFNKEIQGALASRAKEDTAKKVVETKLDETGPFEGVVKDAPVSKIVSVIIRHAIEGGASDIHIEPMTNESRVRYRIDGVLHNSLTLPIDIHSAIIARVKVLANLKLDETRAPQDGRIRLTIDNREVDFRVSSMPLLNQEKIVMRVLDSSKGIVSLDKLGFVGQTAEVLQASFKRSGGIMLVTGPTGSGKSTTLYSLLAILNTEEANIITLEDPIEYQLPGINQSQIRAEIGFTFASGLRSILRQDPDIIMVGEIRDNETAELAIHSALTGHLVLSTLHTNDALGTIARLLDMAVEPFLLSSVLNIALAQRLARRVCTFCKFETKLEEGTFGKEIQEKINNIPVDLIKKVIPDYDPAKVSFVKGKGCSHCGNTGYRSRISIAEAVDFNQGMRDLIVQKKGAVTIEDVRANQPFLTMEQDGLIKAMQGLTTIEEVMRIIQN